MERQGRALQRLTRGAVLMKGGHAEGERCTDLLIEPAGRISRFSAPRAATANTHGTGCTFAAAIAAGLAAGRPLAEAVRRGHDYLQAAIAPPTGCDSAPAADQCTISLAHGAGMAEFQIVGAGVAGLCVATELAARGVPIRLFDRCPDGPGPHSCSWWAGGMLAPDCEGESADPAVTRLGRTAADWWDRQVGGVARRGTLVVALERDGGELDRFGRLAGGHRRLDSDGVAALEPELGGRFLGGLHFVGEAHLRPRAALAGLAARLRADGVPVAIVEPDPDLPTIDCRGLAARDALTDLRGVKGEMAVVRCPDLELSRPVRLLHPRHPIYVVPRGEGEYMIGATMIETDSRRHASVRSVLELLSAAYALSPLFGEAELLEIGAEARPAFADHLPRIRRRGETVFVNGLYRHGFLLAPALARMTADYVLDGKPTEFLDEHIH